MLYLGYTFDVLPNGTIIFDKELSVEHLNAQEGEEYILKVVNGSIILYKKND